MKAIEQYFHVTLFIMLYKVVLSFNSVDKTLVCDHSNESFWAVPFIWFTTLCKARLTFTSEDTISLCDDLNKSCWAIVLSGIQHLLFYKIY